MFRSVFKTGIRANYSLSDHPTFVSEPWSVYPAKSKASGQVVSVFIFDKSKFESQVSRISSVTSGAKHPKSVIYECYERIRFEVGQLVKLRHPQVLTILEVLEETKSKFIFVTESVSDSLLTANFQKDMDTITIQKGLVQLCKGLKFLHEQCNSVHLNIQPSSIYINSSGDWKIAGLRFIQDLRGDVVDQDNFIPFAGSSIPFMNLNMNFTAPELVLDTHQKLNLANDMWSLACLIYYLYNDGESLINCFDINSMSDYKTEFRKFESKFYNQRLSNLKHLFKNIPEEFHYAVQQLLSRYPHDRLTIDSFIASDVFSNPTIKAMLFVDEFSTKSLPDKLTFMKGLLSKEDTQRNILQTFPSSFLNGKMLPLFVDSVVTEAALAESKGITPEVDDFLQATLRIIFKIGSTLSGLSFQDRIYSILLSSGEKGRKGGNKNFKTLIALSIKIRLEVVNHIPLFVSKLKENQISNLIKNSFELCLTSSPQELQSQKDLQIKLQDSLLATVPTFVQKLDFPYVKKEFIPLICTVFKTTTILTTKIATIKCFSDLIDLKIIDTSIASEQLLPILQNMKSRNILIVEQVLKLFLKLNENPNVNLDLEVMVESVLQQSYKLVFSCNDCSKKEFQTLLNMVNEIQKKLVATKLNSLPVTRERAPVKDQQATFDSLINSQSINDDYVREKTPSPAATVMVPSKPSSEHKPAPKKIQPLSLKPKSAANQHNRAPNLTSNLSFGATSADNNSANKSILDSLNGTFSKPTVNNDADEYDDFQSYSGPVPKASSTSPVTSFSSSAKANSATASPPGFNSNMVLQPKNATSQSRPQGNTTYSSMNKNPSINHNSDVLDFL
ncbi:Piso0_002107 [Millerozyma farinosa CBS 7064]|uniref:Piso0_002107 protein n=1 Tax=Pichia sorbitophila (strain ATCC MYA-4447 / BCRC 22081 / CBS 7064 / NBRC 10061 / NRRL Y-12695) TaxID=559304 RepID=G8YE52_PICSO|nr:Piso0_002107 [Millerozyma farinosa CBS 7064]